MGSPDLGRVAAALPAMIRGKKGRQDHIIASLTHIIAHLRLDAMILGEISTVSCARLKRRGYESISDLGDDMRRKKCY
jgi:hypothetical protein